MKKTLIASAIAAATISGTALAQESNLPTVYGNIQYVLTHTNVDGAGSVVDHADNGTTLGVKHDHEIAPGITGFLKLELEGINANNKADSSGIDGLDEAYIGVRGDAFGQVWVGSDDSMYEEAIDEIYNFYEVGSNIGGNYDTGEGDLIQYLSPSFGGLRLGAAVQVNGDSTPGGKSYPYQLAAMYEVDALELAFAMDSNDGSTKYSDNALRTPKNNENTYGMRASYNLDDLRLTASFETRKDVADVFGVMGVYTLGANQFALSYQLRDNDVSGDKDDTVALQALHNLSDNMYVYVEGYLSNADKATEYKLEGKSGDERSIAAVGAVYYF
ncbi:porin [Streptosporangium jomthongense]|uniref:Porin n=1 Tax=Marinobacter aromaticivorans TaxID=1494078 RepID=A0ABW2IYX0_9GAMM|nr:porin [Marinobacter aromaticivorans]GGE74853.1 porin [Streptosporangium jomthongense]